MKNVRSIKYHLLVQAIRNQAEGMIPASVADAGVTRLNMTLLLIDDAGLEWPATSRKLREAFGSPYSGSEFVDYAIANLGFVGIDNYGASCQLRLRPSLVSEACWRGVSKWLRRARSERVVVSWLGSGWSYELIRSTDVALRRVETMIAEAENARRDDFLSRRLAPYELPKGSYIESILRNWENLSDHSSRHALYQLFGERFIVVGLDKGRQNLVYERIGKGLFVNYENWRNGAIGAPLSDTPDRFMGEWAAAGYLDVLESRQPLVEEVDAIVRWPHAGRARMRYKRVIVPIQNSSGSISLLGCSIQDNGIDLRIAHG